jgi:mono/diheme cytochrome c family protein
MRTLRRSDVATVGLTLAVVAATGCGGGSSGGAATTDGGGAKPTADPGHALFTSVGCSSCHTLAAADAHGQVGPNLDTLKPTEAQVAKQVTNGGGGMPAFKDQLSSVQIKQVASYVAKAAGG